jgi:DNA-binding GntR family transcriptional regulator
MTVKSISNPAILSDPDNGKARGVPDDLPVLSIDQINRDQSSNPVMNV